MGVPSLNSAIFYIISLYFQSNRTNITNIPDLGQENCPLKKIAYLHPLKVSDHVLNMLG